MITITKQKSLEEIIDSLKKCQRVFLIGCGTCTTMLHTGGKSESRDEANSSLPAKGSRLDGYSYRL
jgi:hypothetical protein